MNRTISPDIKLIDTLNLPQVEKTYLKNGIPLYALNSGEQEVVKIELAFRAGKWYETKNLVADVANRMLREGTKTKSAKEIADTFDYYGANVQYSTGFENAGVTLYSLTNQAAKLLPLLFEILTEAAFPQHELDTILNNRRQRLKVELEKNDFVCNRNFVDALYGQKHPYGRITLFEDLEQLNVAELESFYRRFYSAHNLFIIISGRFDKSLTDAINDVFGGDSWNGLPAEFNIEHPVNPSTQLIHHTEKPDSVQSALQVGYRTIGKHHPDYLKLSVLNTVFGGYFGSRLMANIREEKGYTYGIHSSLVSYPHDSFIDISSEVGKDVREATLNEIANEINLLRTELIDDDELQTVKNYMTGRIMRNVDGALKFSETLKSLIVFNQGTDYVQKTLDTIRTITAPELRDLANQYLDYEKMYKVTVG
jgi:zinc protease